MSYRSPRPQTFSPSSSSPTHRISPTQFLHLSHSKLNTLTDIYYSPPSAPTGSSSRSTPIRTPSPPVTASSAELLRRSLLIKNAMDHAEKEVLKAEEIAEKEFLAATSSSASGGVKNGWLKRSASRRYGLSSVIEEEEGDADVEEESEAGEVEGEEWFERTWAELQEDGEEDRLRFSTGRSRVGSSGSRNQTEVVVVAVDEDDYDDYVEDEEEESELEGRRSPTTLEYGSDSSTEDLTRTYPLDLEFEIPDSPRLKPTVIHDKFFVPSSSSSTSSSPSSSTSSLIEEVLVPYGQPGQILPLQESFDVYPDSTDETSDDDDSEGPITPPQDLVDDFSSVLPSFGTRKRAGVDGGEEGMYDGFSETEFGEQGELIAKSGVGKRDLVDGKGGFEVGRSGEVGVRG